MGNHKTPIIAVAIPITIPNTEAIIPPPIPGPTYATAGGVINKILHKNTINIKNDLRIIIISLS